MSKEIKVAIAGVGNCASALLQGLGYYSRKESADSAGLINDDIAGYRITDIKPVAAFDVDHRKVGKPLHEAIFAEPNCTTVFEREVPDFGVTVKLAPQFDGVADHMVNYPDEQAFRPAEGQAVDIVEELKASGAEILVCYLPVGSEQAVRHYAKACLEAKVAMVNCIPVFIASNPEFAQAFREAGIPIVGDDIKSQFGATLLHRICTRTLGDRGAQVDRTYQLNTGGNTDFLNMLEQSRLRSKKTSKTEAVQSQLDAPLDSDNIHVGPSDFVPWQKDNKVCFLRLEWRGFGDVPMHLETRLSVEDSPNSAGIVVDAVRCCKVALDRGMAGPIESASACLMKHPPKQMRDAEAFELLKDFIAGK